MCVHAYICFSFVPQGLIFIQFIQIHLRHWETDSHIWYVKFGRQKRFALHLLRWKSLLSEDFDNRIYQFFYKEGWKNWLFLVKLVSFPSGFEAVRYSWTILLMKICNEKTKTETKTKLTLSPWQWKIQILYKNNIKHWHNIQYISKI